MKLLILGATGLLGNCLFKVFQADDTYEVSGTVRSSQSLMAFPESLRKGLVISGDILDLDRLQTIFTTHRPNLVINCTGLTKHREMGQSHKLAIAINSLFPHQLVDLCQSIDAQLIHFSTDCVFSGRTGFYKESDFADADDVYGRSKFLGEVDCRHTITLRTSMIGPEMGTEHGLLEWFLAQNHRCQGYTRALFSGLPTVELAHIIRDYVIPNETLSGLYHVAAAPISKYDLLQLIAEVYQKNIEIIPDDHLVIDRSLNGERFFLATGYRAPAWLQLIKDMHNQHKNRDL